MAKSSKSSKTVVDQLHDKFDELSGVLNDADISLRSAAEETFRKALLLSAASYFEKRVSEDILSIAEEAAGGPGPIVELVKNKAIKRQYHTLFDWERNNANRFFSLFGNDFKEFMDGRMDDSMREAVSAFVEIGRERNRLVHSDFGSFPMEKTSAEVFLLYQKAMVFVESLRDQFQDFTARG